MADEEVKPIEEVAEKPAEVTQDELPLEAAEETAEEKPVEATPETPAEVPTEEPKPDWKEKELKAKHRQLQEAKRREAELQAQLDTQAALLAKFNQGKTPETPVVSIDEIDRRVEERLQQKSYVEKSNAVQADGEKSYGESWKEAISNLEILGGFDMATMNGVLATDSPSKVLFELGKNPDNYHRLMALPLERRIIEMGKMATQPVIKQISNAPAPVNTVGGRAAPAKETLSDKMDDDTWNRIRLAQKRAKWETQHSPRR